jgi:hypothetical protein
MRSPFQGDRRAATAHETWARRSIGRGTGPRATALLVAGPRLYYRGIDLVSKVGGLKELGLEEGFRMSPEDLETLGLKSGDSILVTTGSGLSAAVK